jgi:hypothetical protein
MKNTRLTSILSSGFIACALTLGSLASTQVASAQSSSNMAEVDIPFAFQTPTQTLPAGKYRVVFEANHLIRIQGLSTGAYVVTYETIKTQAPDHSSVVFDHYGDKYYLHEIWTARDTIGLECPKSRAEKETLRAKNTEAPSTIELALNSVPKH